MKKFRILIVGGSKGVGARLVETYLNDGHCVWVIARTQGELTKAMKKYPKHLQLWIIDISNKAEFIRFLSVHTIELESFDIVVNNIGGNLELRDALANSDNYERVNWFNFGYIVDLNRVVIAGMKKRQFGRICNVSSLSAIENHGSPLYCAAKASLNAYTKSLGRILSREKILIFGVMPGAILDESGHWGRLAQNSPHRLEEFKKNMLPSGDFARASDVANFISFLTLSDLGMTPAGVNFLLDSAITRSYLTDTH